MKAQLKSKLAVETKERADKLDDIDNRLAKVEARLDGMGKRLDRVEIRIDRLENKIDKLADKVDSSVKHAQILTATVVGALIALALTLLK